MRCHPEVAAIPRLLPSSLILGMDSLPDIDAFLAVLLRGSPLSFLGASQWQGIHYSRTTMPCALVFVAGRRIACIICCPDLFSRFRLPVMLTYCCLGCCGSPTSDGDLVDDINGIQDSDYFGCISYTDHRSIGPT